MVARARAATSQIPGLPVRSSDAVGGQARKAAMVAQPSGDGRSRTSTMITVPMGMSHHSGQGATLAGTNRSGQVGG
jgi:hypothetical protein